MITFVGRFVTPLGEAHLRQVDARDPASALRWFAATYVRPDDVGWVEILNARGAVVMSRRWPQVTDRS
jgi:hypothetical protein